MNTEAQARLAQIRAQLGLEPAAAAAGEVAAATADGGTATAAPAEPAAQESLSPTSERQWSPCGRTPSENRGSGRRL